MEFSRHLPVYLKAIYKGFIHNPTYNDRFFCGAHRARNWGKLFTYCASHVFELQWCARKGLPLQSCLLKFFSSFPYATKEVWWNLPKNHPKFVVLFVCTKISWQRTFGLNFSVPDTLSQQPLLSGIRWHQTQTLHQTGYVCLHFHWNNVR